MMEANKYAFHVTGHKCDAPNAQGVYNNCDRGGQCTMDVLTNSDDFDYGPGSQYTIDTNSEFHVRQDFHESSDGQFQGYTTVLTQGSNEVILSTGDCSYLNNMTEDMKRMVFVISNWGSDSLNWLQHGVCSGSCSNSSTRSIIKNIEIQTTGAAVIPDSGSGDGDSGGSTEPTEYVFGGACNNLTDGLCGSSCAACHWSWPVGENWDSSDANCRCQTQADDGSGGNDGSGADGSGGDGSGSGGLDTVDGYTYGDQCVNIDDGQCGANCYSCRFSWPVGSDYGSDQADCRCYEELAFGDQCTNSND